MYSHYFYLLLKFRYHNVLFKNVINIVTEVFVVEKNKQKTTTTTKKKKKKTIDTIVTVDTIAHAVDGHYCISAVHYCINM